VSEWCWDRYVPDSDYGTGAQTNPRGPEVNGLFVDLDNNITTSNPRVTRGGGFAFDATGQRSAARNPRGSFSYSQTVGANDYRFTGFRVVRGAPNSPAPKTVINAPSAPSVTGMRGKISASELQALLGEIQAVRREEIFRDDMPVGQ
jgi:hypothetical protein